MSLTKDEIAEVVKQSIQAGIHEQEQAAFWVDREEHHDHHEFLKELINFLKDTRTTVWKTFVRTSIVGILGIFVLGFIAWMKFKGV
jgi:preprotein translocase subunit Sss1